MDEKSFFWSFQLHVLTNETAEAVNMQANHFSDSLQARGNQPKGVNCYTIQYNTSLFKM